MDSVAFVQFIEGSEKYYCRVKGCDLFTWSNIPYSFCSEHLLKHLLGMELEIKLGFPEPNTNIQQVMR